MIKKNLLLYKVYRGNLQTTQDALEMDSLLNKCFNSFCVPKLGAVLLGTWKKYNKHLHCVRQGLVFRSGYSFYLNVVHHIGQIPITSYKL